MPCETSFKAQWLRLVRDSGAHMPTQVVNSAGSWFSYVSCMTLVQRLGGSSALLVSGIVIIRVLPAALFFPFSGVVADRFAVPETARKLPHFRGLELGVTHSEGTACSQRDIGSEYPFTAQPRHCHRSASAITILLGGSHHDVRRRCSARALQLVPF